MSARFWVEKSEGGTCEIEIDRDGSLTLHEYDIEFALAMQEFGESPDIPFQLYEEWKKNPMDFISFAFGLTRRQLSHLALDFVEHAFLKADGANLAFGVDVEEAINTSKLFFDGKVETETIAAIFKRFNKIHLSMAAKLQAIAFSNTKMAKLIVDATWEMLRSIIASTLDRQKHFFSEADFESLFILTSDHSVGAVELKPIESDELYWQVRRFVHVMEAEQQGLPRPEVGDTK